MKEKKEFKTEILLSLTTGKLLTEDFNDVHEASEFILGDFVFTHHFASDELWKKIRSLVLEQHPDLLPELGDDINRHNVWEKRDALIARLGETRFVVKGNGEAAMNAFEGIPKDKKVSVVKL